jgi:hypothetical protein
MTRSPQTSDCNVCHPMLTIPSHGLLCSSILPSHWPLALVSYSALLPRLGFLSFDPQPSVVPRERPFWSETAPLPILSSFSIEKRNFSCSICTTCLPGSPPWEGGCYDHQCPSSGSLTMVALMSSAAPYIPQVLNTCLLSE